MNKSGKSAFGYVKHNLLFFFILVLISANVFAKERPFIWVKQK